MLICFALRYVAWLDLRWITSHYSGLHYIITLHYITFDWIGLHWIAWHYITYSTVQYRAIPIHPIHPMQCIQSIHPCMHAYVHAYTHAYIHAFTYAFTYTHTHTNKNGVLPYYRNISSLHRSAGRTHLGIPGLVILMENIDEQSKTNISENYPHLEIVPPHWQIVRWE